MANGEIVEQRTTPSEIYVRFADGTEFHKTRQDIIDSGGTRLVRLAELKAEFLNAISGAYRITQFRIDIDTDSFITAFDYNRSGWGA